jgi:hypothetical protein
MKPLVARHGLSHSTVSGPWPQRPEGRRSGNGLSILAIIRPPYMADTLHFFREGPRPAETTQKRRSGVARPDAQESSAFTGYPQSAICGSRPAGAIVDSKSR